MPITKMSINGYRGFKTPGVVSFAVPNGKPGSGLTIITGSNNSGKSSILECLRARVPQGHGTSFPLEVRNADAEVVDIVYTVNGKDEVIRSVRKGASETERSAVDLGFDTFVLPSRRAFAPYFGRNYLSREQYVQSTPLPVQRISTLNHFESRLFSILRAPAAFNDILERVLGYRPDWNIDMTSQGSTFSSSTTERAGIRATAWARESSACSRLSIRSTT